MSFLTFLKSNAEARKVFGQRELKIIEKQLLGINLTQSEKNRLSRDIRKKLAFIKEAARFSDEFTLKKGAMVRHFIQEALEVIREHKLFFRVTKIILFGSTVDNTRTFRSDIDLAVIFTEISPEEAFKFRIRVLGQLPDFLDIQVYNHLPEKIRKEIDSKGRVLYERKDK